MNPVGYKRVNKLSGKDSQADFVVRAIKLADGDYVILSDDQITAVYPKSTKTFETESFVKASEIALTLLETPYYLETTGKGEKVYVLVREATSSAQISAQLYASAQTTHTALRKISFHVPNICIADECLLHRLRSLGP